MRTRCLQKNSDDFSGAYVFTFPSIWAVSAENRMAYTSIAIQFTPVYLMKELDLRRKQGLDLEIWMIPVSSRAVQSALAGELHFITSGGVANINANMAA